jgi:hypothetical protein
MNKYSLLQAMELHLCVQPGDCATNPHDGTFRQYSRGRADYVRRASIVMCAGVSAFGLLGRGRPGPAQLLVLLSSATARLRRRLSLPWSDFRTTKDDCRKPCLASLRDRNEKARFRIRPLRAALTTSREVHSEVPSLRRTIGFAGGNDAVCPKTKRELPCSRNYSQPLR